MQTSRNETAHAIYLFTNFYFFKPNLHRLVHRNPEIIANFRFARRAANIIDNFVVSGVTLPELPTQLVLSPSYQLKNRISRTEYQLIGPALPFEG